MQPLKILAIALGGAPLLAFLLTLYLTEGAPFQSRAPGEESGPAVAAPVLPQSQPQRLRGAGTAGHSDGEPVGLWRPGDAVATTPARPAGWADKVDAERDAKALITLFGVPIRQQPVAR